MRSRQTFTTITGRTFDLRELSAEEKRFLKSILAKYKQNPKWSAFATYWTRAFEHSDIADTSPVYRICNDLEARLGIAQGKVAAPDYRDYLADLIDARYGSRYKFCRETGMDPAHLSRVFAGRSDLSLGALKRILELLGAVLVVRPQQDLLASTSPHEASISLASIH